MKDETSARLLHPLHLDLQQALLQYGLMATVARKSLPLTEKDLHDLRLLQERPDYRESLRMLTGLATTPDLPESTLLHALFEAGMSAVRQEADAAAYAQLAADEEATLAERKAVARRRRPSWADEQ